MKTRVLLRLLLGFCNFIGSLSTFIALGALFMIIVLKNEPTTPTPIKMLAPMLFLILILFVTGLSFLAIHSKLSEKFVDKETKNKPALKKEEP